MTKYLTQYWLLTVLLLGLSTQYSLGQELNCNVVINRQRAQSIDQRRFDDMKRMMQDFLNLRRWTDEKYENQERINCNLVLTIDEVDASTTRFKTTAQIQASRPVYGTGYETLMINFVDKDFEFEFQEGQAMDYNENAYTTHLVALLSFYAHVILAYDYDSFSKKGGQPYFLKAQNIMNTAGSAAVGFKGWQVFDGPMSRGRFLDDLLSPALTPFREANYEYHRNGLDVFGTQPDNARTKVKDALLKVQQAQQQKQICIVITNWFDAKANELINMFNDGSPGDKQQVYNLCVAMDPTKADRYQKLIK